MALATEQLAKLIDQKHECARQLHALGQAQLECIAAGDFTRLMRILSGKQRLLGVLQKIERELDPFRSQAPESRQWTSAAAREHCANVARACETLLGEVMTQERLSEGQLVSQRDGAAQRLQGTHGAARALGAYLAGADLPPGQLDLVSGS